MNAQLLTKLRSTAMVFFLPIYMLFFALSVLAQGDRVIMESISISGSDALNNVVGLWAGEYQKKYPVTKVQIQSAGSSTAPTALIEGVVDIAAMSRRMSAQELHMFEQRYGYLPTAIPVAVDLVALVVHLDNPMEAITVKALDGIFSANQQCYSERAINYWGQLGLSKNFERKPIRLFGRGTSSGTHGFFKEQALCGGEYRSNIEEQVGSAALLQGVATNLGGIGYVSASVYSAHVKYLDLIDGQGKRLSPSPKDQLQYPLARTLYLYINMPFDEQIPSKLAKFLSIILSNRGQEIVKREGYFPLTLEQRHWALKIIQDVNK